MKINKEFQGLNEQELKPRLEEFRKELFKFNSRRSTGANPESPGKMNQTKKNIARVLTILKQKEKQLVQ